MTFLVLWIDDLLIYSQAEEEEHLKHLHLGFANFREAGIKLKICKCEFLLDEIEYLGHLVSGQGISPMRQKIKTITDLAPITNITEARHMIGLIGYYRKFFPIFSDMIRLLNELTEKIIPYKCTKQCQKILDYVTQAITTNPI